MVRPRARFAHSRPTCGFTAACVLPLARLRLRSCRRVLVAVLAVDVAMGVAVVMVVGRGCAYVRVCGLVFAGVGCLVSFVVVWGRGRVHALWL